MFGKNAGMYQKVSVEGPRRRKQFVERNYEKLNDENENDMEQTRRLWERIKSKHTKPQPSVLEKLAVEKSCRRKGIKAIFDEEDQNAQNGSTKGCKRSRERTLKSASKS